MPGSLSVQVLQIFISLELEEFCHVAKDGVDSLGLGVFL